MYNHLILVKLNNHMNILPLEEMVLLISSFWQYKQDPQDYMQLCISEIDSLLSGPYLVLDFLS